MFNSPSMKSLLLDGLCLQLSVFRSKVTRGFMCDLMIGLPHHRFAHHETALTPDPRRSDHHLACFQRSCSQPYLLMKEKNGQLFLFKS